MSVIKLKNILTRIVDSRLVDARKLHDKHK